MKGEVHLPTCICYITRRFLAPNSQANVTWLHEIVNHVTACRPRFLWNCELTADGIYLDPGTSGFGGIMTCKTVTDCADGQARIAASHIVVLQEMSFWSWRWTTGHYRRWPVTVIRLLRVNLARPLHAVACARSSQKIILLSDRS